MLDSPTVPAVLSTPEFHARVHSLSPRIAVFDCDGTLWSSDAGSSFMRFTLDQAANPGLVPPAQIKRLKERYQEYLCGDVSELQICGEMVQVYRGLSIDTLRVLAATFFRTHIEPHIFPEMLQLVTTLQRDGCDIWAVSSTNDWVIEEGMRRFNIPPNRVLAARVEIHDGIVTSNLIDVPTDEGKVAALRAVGIAAGGNAPDCVFGNSVHDAAMLSIATTNGAFPVNPSRDLVRRSAAEAWPIYYPASVQPRP